VWVDNNRDAMILTLRTALNKAKEKKNGGAVVVKQLVRETNR